MVVRELVAMLMGQPMESKVTICDEEGYLSKVRFVRVKRVYGTENEGWPHYLPNRSSSYDRETTVVEIG